MTIYRTILSRGYFPKELPPAFYTDLFAQYATSQAGRAQLSAYKPTDNFTECVKYMLALPGLNRRELRIPHPFSYSSIATLTAKHLRRLLKKAATSPCSKSRPVYSDKQDRAILPMLRPSNVCRERVAARAGASFLLKADISQFYPSLYTHAVGWAIDPKLRDKKNWRNTRLLGKQFDQALMDLDGKMSQGIPIGVDISFLLAEIVLGQVDKAVRIPKDRAVRWYDDYEVAFNSRSDAEATLKKLNRELSRYRLRLNPKKTAILALPRASQEDWRQTLIESILGSFVTPNLMVSYFDTAFRLRERYPDTDILLYSLGRLFKIQRPSVEVGRIAESCITQALLSEPGCAQKAFALLSYWALNGYRLNIDLIRRTIESVILRHAAGGLSSDVAWSLAFCLDQKIYLGRDAAKLLSILDDDCIALQALHMNSVGLLPNGFSDKGIAKELAKSDLDREHWLLAYESVRHNFMNTCAPLIAKNSLFSDLLKQRVTFYRTSLPSYAMVIQPGSASDWLVKSWLGSIEKRAAKGADAVTVPPMVELLEKDAPRVLHDKMSPEGIRLSFLNVESDELGFEFDGGSY